METTADQQSIGFEYVRVILLRANDASVNNNSLILNNGSAKSNVTFKLRGVVNSPDDIKLMTMRLRSAIFPNIFYNITNALLRFVYINHTLSITVNLTVPNGVYDIYSLVDALNVAIDGVAPFADTAVLSTLISIAYNITTNRVSFLPLTFLSGASLSVIATPLLAQLGFNFTGSMQLIQNAPSTAAFGPNLTGVDTILISCPDIPTENFCSVLNDNIFASFPVNQDLLTEASVLFDNQGGFVIPSATQLENLTFYLRDQDGNFLDFQNYAWTMVLEVTVTKSQMPQYEDLLTSIAKLSDQIKNQDQQGGAPEEKEAAASEQDWDLFRKLQQTELLRQLNEEVLNQPIDESAL